MKFPPDLGNFTGSNGLANFCSKFATAPSNKLILSCKPNWSPRRKKTMSCETWLLEDVLQKSLPKNFTKFTDNYLCLSLFLILLKTFRLSRLQLYWRETPARVSRNQLFVVPLQNRCSWIIHKIFRKTALLESLFN